MLSAGKAEGSIRDDIDARDVLLLLTYDPSEVYTLEPLLAVPRSLFIITVKVNEASVSLRS